MFNEQAKQIIKKIYDTFDMDFAMRETKELFERAYGQTFDNYKMESDYAYDLLKKEGFEPELYTFKADGITTYQDKRMPIAWTAKKGKLTVLSSSVPFADPVIADYEKMPFALIKHSVSTPEGGLHTKIILEEHVLAGEDCTGCLVLINSRPGIVSKYLDLGAIGIVSDYITSADDNPDCTYWVNACTDDNGHWHVQSEDRDFIGYMVTPRIGRQLRLACANGTVEVLAECDGRRYVGEIDGITATLKGKTNKEFWLLAHLYEPLPSDNSMGVVGAITILKCIREMVEKGVIPAPDCTIRVLFAMEHYGFSALYEALGTGVTDNVLGGLNIDGLPECDKNNIRIIYPPYSSPFFATTFMRSALDIYEEIYPNTEYKSDEFVQFTDDTFLGDSTTGVPTMWLMYGVDPKYANQHNSCVKFSWLDKDKFARVLSIICFVAMASVSKVIPIKDMLDNALAQSNEKIRKAVQKNMGEAYVSFFKRGEKDIILSFKKISDSPLIEQYASKIDDTYVEFECENGGKWQNYAKTIIPSRVDKGLPFDRARVPKGERRTLPDRVIYGPFGLLLSAMDGKKDLERLIREAVWEDGRPLTEALFREYVNGVFYLEKYGYLKVEEKAPLTKDDLVKALKELGVKESDIVVLHSSLSGCGHVQGGENAIIEAFTTCADTLLAPSFTRPYVAFEGSVNRNKGYTPYDKNDFDNIWTGAIPIAMLKQGAIRSAHASHSWCGLGQKAELCLKEHGLLDPPTGDSSPLAVALRNKGKIVTYGVGANALTFLHYVEDKMGSAFLANAVVKVKGEDGKVTTEVIHRHLPGCRGFYKGDGFDSKIMRKAIEKGLEVKSVKFGIGKIYMFDMEELYQKAVEVFKEDKNATLCENPNCLFCRKYD